MCAVYTSKLQAVLATSSQGSEGPQPHHPIACGFDNRLWMEEDGSLRCPHTTAAPDDQRTIACLNHSVALLMMELAEKL